MSAVGFRANNHPQQGCRMSKDRLHDVALNLAIACGVHEQSTAYEVIVATLDDYAKEELESFVGFLAHAHPDDWRRWVDAARSQR